MKYVWHRRIFFFWIELHLLWNGTISPKLRVQIASNQKVSVIVIIQQRTTSVSLIFMVVVMFLMMGNDCAFFLIKSSTLNKLFSVFLENILIIWHYLSLSKRIAHWFTTLHWALPNYNEVTKTYIPFLRIGKQKTNYDICLTYGTLQKKILTEYHFLIFLCITYN